MGDFFLSLLAPLESVVSTILLAFHWLLTRAGLPTGSGVTWALSIMGLVVTIRILLIPLFVKQIRAQRGLQLLQPQIKKLQELHKNDKQKQSAALMELYKTEGTNPFASCLPILLQSPIFFALFRVLNDISNGRTPAGFDRDLVSPARNATLFGAKISDTFLGANEVSVQAVAAVLIVLMCATTFLTQRQVMTQNMPKESLSGNPFMQQQKMLLYIFPVIFAVTGVNFPIGVLIYWFTTNVWSMGQQFYVIRRNPAPGSPAHDAMVARRSARGAGRSVGGPSLTKDGKGSTGGMSSAGGASTTDGTGSGPSLRKARKSTPASPATPSGSGSTALGAPGAAGTAPRTQRQQPKRQQPKRQPRSKR